ncbi:MAG: 3'-5' exonuclease [Burkholderiales bacterium]
MSDATMSQERIQSIWQRLRQALASRTWGVRSNRSVAQRGATHGETDQTRWVVLDCETTGLDPEQDTLISMGAVAIVDGAIRLSDRFERLLRPPTPSVVANVLIHGIGQQSQSQAEDPALVLQDWVRWLGDSPCIAFHARFDRGFLERATRQHLGRVLRSAWLDLAELGPSVDAEARARSLDDWLDRYDIRVSPRHQASADALASAMHLQRWLARLPAGERQFKALQHRARHRHLLGS